MNRRRVEIRLACDDTGQLSWRVYVDGREIHSRFMRSEALWRHRHLWWALPERRRSRATR